MTDPIPLHPQPSVPNPLTQNPWARMSDEEIRESIQSVGYRIDAAEHTRQSLLRELDRRASLLQQVSDEPRCCAHVRCPGGSLCCCIVDGGLR